MTDIHSTIVSKYQQDDKAEIFIRVENKEHGYILLRLDIPSKDIQIIKDKWNNS